MSSTPRTSISTPRVIGRVSPLENDAFTRYNNTSTTTYQSQPVIRGVTYPSMPQGQITHVGARPAPSQTYWSFSYTSDRYQPINTQAISHPETRYGNVRFIYDPRAVPTFEAPLTVRITHDFFRPVVM